MISELANPRLSNIPNTNLDFINEKMKLRQRLTTSMNTEQYLWSQYETQKAKQTDRLMELKDKYKTGGFVKYMIPDGQLHFYLNSTINNNNNVNLNDQEELEQ